MADDKTPTPGRFRLRKQAFMPTAPGAPGRLLDAGTVVLYAKRPNEHMEPLDEVARDMMDRYGVKRGELRPEMALPLHAPGGGEAGAMMRQATGTDEYDARFAAIEARLAVLEAAHDAAASMLDAAEAAVTAAKAPKVPKAAKPAPTEEPPPPPPPPPPPS